MEDRVTTPGSNNVYGLIAPASNDLRPLLEVLRPLADGGKLYIYKSGFNGAETLHLRTESADLESEPLEETGVHLFNGGIAGTPQEVAAYVCRVAELLSSVGTEYALEVYDSEQNLHAEFLSPGRDIRQRV